MLRRVNIASCGHGNASFSRPAHAEAAAGLTGDRDGSSANSPAHTRVRS